MKRKIFILSFALLLPFIFSAFCNTVKADIFVVNLIYDPTTKRLDFDSQTKIAVDKEKDIPLLEFLTKDQQTGNYSFKLFDINGYDLFGNGFNSKQGLFQLEIPYAATAKTIKIYNTDNKEIMSADLSQFVTCNSNGICEFEKGETAQNCISDCANSAPQFSPKTISKLNENSGVIKNPANGDVVLRNNPSPTPSQTGQTMQPETIPSSTGSSFIPLLIAVLVFIIALIVTGIVLYKKYFRKK
jgi:hypothetical protein